MSRVISSQVKPLCLILDGEGLIYPRVGQLRFRLHLQSNFDFLDFFVRGRCRKHHAIDVREFGILVVSRRVKLAHRRQSSVAIDNNTGTGDQDRLSLLAFFQDFGDRHDGGGALLGERIQQLMLRLLRILILLAIQKERSRTLVLPDVLQLLGPRPSVRHSVDRELDRNPNH